MSNALPLFSWQMSLAASRLAEKRMALQKRINALPRFSHKRIELEVRMKQLTASALEAETSASKLDGDL